jgi:hypothetical protein
MWVATRLHTRDTFGTSGRADGRGGATLLAVISNSVGGFDPTRR